MSQNVSEGRTPSFTVPSYALISVHTSGLSHLFAARIMETMTDVLSGSEQ
jgi:siroheme synthase (precorrin-2 oxidase/ferrochelatase)